MRFIHSDIRNSLFQDFKDRIEEHEEINIEDFDINESRIEITYLPTGNKILSKGFRKSQGSATAKLKSIAGATDIIIEEAEEIEEKDFDKLMDSLRTNKAPIKIYRIFNPPPKNHWIIKNYYDIHPLTNEHEPSIEESILEGYFIGKPKQIDDFISIFSTYENNSININEKTRKRFENYKNTNIDHYLTDIKGYIPGGAKGLIYKHFKELDSWKLPDIEFYRLLCTDFGHTDPYGIAELNINASSKTCYIREICYKTELTTSELIAILKENNPENDENICDSARPDKISELQAAGLNAIPATKGADSIVSGIDTVKEYKILYIGENIKKEVLSYKWKIGVDKEPTGKPEDKNNHLLDAIRYGLTYYHLNFGIYE